MTREPDSQDGTDQQRDDRQSMEEGRFVFGGGGMGHIMIIFWAVVIAVIVLTVAGVI